MRRYLFLLLPILTAACAPSFKNFDAAKQPAGRAFIALSVDATFDGEKQDKCFVGLKALDNDQNLEISALDDSHLRLVGAPSAGRYYFDSITCSKYSVLWNKVRSRDINPPLYVNAAGGSITYPGTLVINWDSSSFNMADVWSAGGAINDSGTMTVKLEDRSAEIKALLTEQNPTLMQMFPFVVNGYEGNPIFQQ